MRNLPSNQLPERKMRELKQIVKIIRGIGKNRVHQIILFGSHARGDWVEDIYVEDGATFEYMSDLDIMVVGEGSDFAENVNMQYEISEQIDATRFIRTWYSLIYEDIDHVNEELRLHNYFYSDVVKEGFALYDSGKLELNEEPPELSEAERKKLCQEYYEIWTDKARESIEMAEYAKSKGFLNQAAFQLHQATEGYMASVRLVYTGYKPKTHDLKKLYRKILVLDRRFSVVFPRSTPVERRIFDLLRRAYTDARFKKTFNVTEQEIDLMLTSVKELGVLNRSSCEEKVGD